MTDLVQLVRELTRTGELISAARSLIPEHYLEPWLADAGLDEHQIALAMNVARLTEQGGAETPAQRLLGAAVGRPLEPDRK